MTTDGGRLYLGRKSGRGMGVGWTVRSLVPALLVALVTAILVFSMVFISSMTSSINRMIVMLGAGSITAYTDPSSYLDSSVRSDKVKSGEGIIYSRGGKSLVHLKGVDPDYFDGERGEVLSLVTGEEGKNPITVSSTLARRLSLAMGDTLTLMLWEEENDRARPVLMTVSGIFDSGYAQLDRYLAFVPSSLLGGDGVWEIVLEKGMDADKKCAELLEKGLWCQSYREKYRDLARNVEESVSVLYVILLSVALLAAFFSTDIAHVYISRDRDDIMEMSMLGMRTREIRAIYRRLTLRAVAVSGLFGIALGAVLGLFSPSIIRAVAEREPEIAENYISSFSVTFPLLPVLLMFLLMLLLSALSVSLSLRKTIRGGEGERVLAD